MTTATPPRLTIPEPGWNPGPPASHELGEFFVHGPASLLTRGWLDDDAPVGVDLDQLDLGADRVQLSLRAGAWRGRLVIQPDLVPEELATELARHPDGKFLESVFLVTHRRPWLVLSHADLHVGLPQPVAHVSVAELRRDEGLASMPFEVATDEGPIELSCVGQPEPWVQRVAVVLGDSKHASARSALAGVGWDSLVSVWDWGLLFLCGRDGGFVVMAGGPDTARTIVAIPGRI